METICEGENNKDTCPIRLTCYRYTNAYYLRDRYSLPYDFQANACDLFLTNIPDTDFVQLTAYYIWLREGKPVGKADEHFQRAYADLAKGMNKYLDITAP